jgi:hypothetical protein
MLHASELRPAVFDDAHQADGRANGDSVTKKCSELPDEDDQALADLLAIGPERGELVSRRPGRRHAHAGQVARRRHVADARFDNSPHGARNRVTELRGSE